jgi:hypothetical protein
MAATIQDTSSFAGPREFAAFLGLTPKQNSSGGKHRLGRISKMGNRDLRRPRCCYSDRPARSSEPHPRAAFASTVGIALANSTRPTSSVEAKYQDYYKEREAAPHLPRSFTTQPQFMPNLHVSAAHDILGS